MPGLFNIGAQGQVILGAIFASYVAFAWSLPPMLHMVVAVLAGLLGGALWGGIVGLLKARSGAHEVITSIMLNYIAFYVGAYLLTTEAFLRPGRNDPISPPAQDSAVFPLLLGDSYRLHLGVIVVLGAVVARAVAAQPEHARLPVPRRGRQPRGRAHRGDPRRADLHAS